MMQVYSEQCFQTDFKIIFVFSPVRWPSAAIINFQFENNILFKKEIQTFFKILKHLLFQSNLQMK